MLISTTSEKGTGNIARERAAIRLISLALKKVIQTSEKQALKILGGRLALPSEESLFQAHISALSPWLGLNIGTKLAGRNVVSMTAEENATSALNGAKPFLRETITLAKSAERRESILKPTI